MTSRLDQQDIFDKLKARISLKDGGVGDDVCLPLEGDHTLNPDFGLHPFARHKNKRASVLVPIIDRPEGLTVLLTKRTDHLPDHPGQIAFPGGGEEPRDVDAIAAALRETEEEVGIPGEFIEVLGILPPYKTGTGFHLTTVIAMVNPNFKLVLDEQEVKEVFEVPLAFFLNPDNHKKHSPELMGKPRHSYAMTYGNYFIWGVTAGVLVNVYAALKIYGGKDDLP
jgi:8-oxo-dGTP pyrophosphatase MutT (NUDIX family)